MAAAASDRQERRGTRCQASRRLRVFEPERGTACGASGTRIPFHVVDDDTVVLSLDHPFVKEGRFASLVVGDRELADSLAEGFTSPGARL
jgi:hypothetical protein